MKQFILTIALMGLIIVPTGCVTGQRGFPPKDQIVNFDKVDSKVMRGAQPNAAGLEALAKVGKDAGKKVLVINLRQPNDGWVLEYAECKRLGMEYINMPMSGTSAPNVELVRQILKLIEEWDGLVFIHCQYGCDRTGVTIACYRVTKGLSNEDAYNDAKFHGISKLLPGFRAFILHFKP